jgi:imidazolonepropionase-like amidohydrolase
MLIRNAHLWDGTGAPPRAGTALHVSGDRIDWIGPEGRAPAPADGEVVIDAAAHWLVPGLIDLHVHLTFDTAEGDFRRFNTTVPVPEQALLGARHARLMLEAGFTSARDCGAIGWANVALKHAIDAGWVPGPRLQTVGGLLTVTGGHFDALFRPEVDVPAASVICGPQAARQAVREQVKRGADWIKLLVTGGVMTGSTPLAASLWETDELRAAVATAGRLGRKVAAHCHGAAGMIAAAEAGVATIEHGTMGDAAAAAAMVGHGTALVPTFTAAAAVARAAESGHLPPAVAAQARLIGPSHRAAFKEAIDAGVLIACGTDTGVPGTLFGENAVELLHLVDNGLTPEQALLAATRDAAALLGWEADTGTLQSGRLADCLLLDADPLADAGVLGSGGHLRLVLKGGTVAADYRTR